MIYSIVEKQIDFCKYRFKIVKT